MANNKPIYQDLLDILDEKISDTTILTNYNNEDSVQPLNWINNYTRLNSFNMNSLYSFIEAYSNWAVTKTTDYINKNIIEPLVLSNAGWVDPNSRAGEIFNDYYNNQATGAFSSAFGENNKASSDNQFVIGKFNEADDNAVFIVGWGENDSNRKNIVTIQNDGNLRISGTPNNPQDVINKGLFDDELGKIKQLNQWIGATPESEEDGVTSSIYNDNAELQDYLNKFVLANSPGHRDPRNGDLVTVNIVDPSPKDPKYPEIWIFLENNPGDPSEHSGEWKFYTSLQQLLDASENVKGLVKIGENINVEEGTISVYTGSKSLKGVLQVGDNIDVTAEGLISVPNATSTVLGVVTQGDNVNINDGVISIPLANDSTAGVVKAGENVTIENGVISSYQYWIDF